MNSLPNQNGSGIKPEPANPPVAGGLQKEIEVGGSVGEIPGVKDIGYDIELPAEVARAGVRIPPTTVQIPPKVSRMGVKTIGAVRQAQTSTIALPLNDDQIVQGLHQSVKSSWRWFAEWCIRRLKQLLRNKNGQEAINRKQKNYE